MSVNATYDPNSGTCAHFRIDTECLVLNHSHEEYTISKICKMEPDQLLETIAALSADIILMKNAFENCREELKDVSHLIAKEIGKDEAWLAYAKMIQQLVFNRLNKVGTPN